MTKSLLKKNIIIFFSTFTQFGAMTFSSFLLSSLTLNTSAYAESLPIVIENMLTIEERIDENYKMPSYLNQFSWHNQLKNKDDDNKILNTLWDSSAPENKITAIKIISDNYQSYAVYDWLKNRVIHQNDLELAIHLIEMVSLYSHEEASFWLHYYTLSAVEDAAQCAIERKRKRSIANIFREAQHLNDDINIPVQTSLSIADEVIEYADSRQRHFWQGACGLDDKQKSQRVEKKKKRAQIKFNIRKNYISLFEQNVL